MKNLFALLLVSTSIFADSSQEREELFANLHSRGISQVDFVFTDLDGRLRSVTMPRQFVKDALDNGLKFDGSSIPGCSQIFESDMHLEPDISSVKYLTETVKGRPSAAMVCNVRLSETEDYSGDPRTFLQGVSASLQEKGYNFLCGPEIEFHLLDKAALVEGEVEFPDENKYFDCLNDSGLNDITTDILDALTDSGIETEKLHHEVGPGQYEVSLKYAPAVQMADSIVLAKHIIKSIADRYGLVATFMPKPIFGQNGNGMHIHYSLWDEANGGNAFYDGSDDLNLSAVAKAFLNGNVKYLKSVAAFINPTINSYKRLVPGYEAPIYVCVGKMNRSAAIRIPLVNKAQPNATRAELRAPDPACNPYLAFAVIGATGLRGLEENNAVLKTVDQSLYKMEQSQIKEMGIDYLPASLAQALEALENSEEKFVNDRIVEEFVKQKHGEVYSYNTAVHWWEVDKYA